MPDECDRWLNGSFDDAVAFQMRCFPDDPIEMTRAGRIRHGDPQAGFAPGVPHFTNLPPAPRHFFAGEALGGGHLMNLPCAPRQRLAAIDGVATMATAARAKAKRFMRILPLLECKTDPGLWAAQAPVRFRGFVLYGEHPAQLHHYILAGRSDEAWV